MAVVDGDELVAVVAAFLGCTHAEARDAEARLYASAAMATSAFRVNTGLVVGAVRWLWVGRLRCQACIAHGFLYGIPVVAR